MGEMRRLADIVIVNEWRALVPRPTPSEYENLKQSIKKYGMQEPIKLDTSLRCWDGFTRYDITTELHQPMILTRVYKLDTEDIEAKIIEVNIHRRHLSTAQKAELGLKLLDLEREKAQKRMQATQFGAGGTLASPPAGSPQTSRATTSDLTAPSPEASKSARSAAAKVGISATTLKDAAVIEEVAKTDPEIEHDWEDAKAGKMTVKTVAKKAREKKKAAEQPREIFLEVTSISRIISTAATKLVQWKWKYVQYFTEVEKLAIAKAQTALSCNRDQIPIPVEEKSFDWIYEVLQEIEKRLGEIKVNRQTEIGDW